MRKEDNEVRSELNEISQETVEEACKLLSSSNASKRKYLLDFVASICDVDPNDMFSPIKKLDFVHARWLYWYAYQYLTNETCSHISRMESDKREFTASGVNTAISRMSMMIANQAKWKNKWLVVKRIIGIMNEECGTEMKLFSEQNETKTVTVTIVKPRDVEVKVDIKSDK